VSRRRPRRFTLQRSALAGEAAWRLLLAYSAVSLLPFGRVAQLWRLGPGETPDDSAAAVDAVATQVAWAVDAAACRLPFDSTCLMRALAGAWMLRRRRIPATVYLGAARDPDDATAMIAHAWLRVGPAIVAGEEGHERFGVVGRFASGCRVGSTPSPSKFSQRHAANRAMVSALPVKMDSGRVTPVSASQASSNSTASTESNPRPASPSSASS
jgi:hypothetical protein